MQVFCFVLFFVFHAVLKFVSHEILFQLNRCYTNNTLPLNQTHLKRVTNKPVFHEVLKIVSHEILFKLNGCYTNDMLPLNQTHLKRVTNKPVFKIRVVLPWVVDKVKHNNDNQFASFFHSFKRLFCLGFVKVVFSVISLFDWKAWKIVSVRWSLNWALDLCYLINLIFLLIEKMPVLIHTWTSSERFGQLSEYFLRLH